MDLHAIYRKAQRVRAHADRVKDNILSMAMLDAMILAKRKMENPDIYIPDHILRNIEEGLSECATTSEDNSRYRRT